MEEKQEQTDSKALITLLGQLIETLPESERAKLIAEVSSLVNAGAEDLADQLNQTPTKLNLPQTNDEIPEWVELPPEKSFVRPKHKQVLYIRFKAKMTDTPNKGDRQCIIWSNNIGDQKLAINRADRDPNRMHEMLVKQMIRAIDGHVVDVSDPNSEYAIEPWYDSIGPKCRSILDKIYFQLHTASRDEAVDFFEDCIAVRVGGG